MTGRNRFRQGAYGYPSSYAYSYPFSTEEEKEAPNKTRRKRKTSKPKLTLRRFALGVLALALIARAVHFTWDYLSGEVQPEKCDICGAVEKDYFRITVHGHKDYGADSVGIDAALSAAAAAGGRVDTEEYVLCNACYGDYLAFWRGLNNG